MMTPSDMPSLIAIFGATGTGKTTFVNNASGGDLQVGDDLDACTKQIASSPVFHVDGHSVVLFDTPGFDDTELPDTEILAHISGFLATSYKEGYKLTGIIYLHRITDNRMGGVSRRTFNLLRELCGKDSLTNVLIVTNMWSDPPTKGEQRREAQLEEDPKYFKPALDEGAQLTQQLHNTEESTHNIIRLLLKKSPIVMRLQEELVDDGMELRDTGAGRILNQDLMVMEERHKQDLATIEKKLQKALQDKDDTAKHELQEYQAEVRAEFQRLAQRIESLTSGYTEERGSWENRVVKAEEAKNREGWEVERLHLQLDTLRQQSANARGESKFQISRKIWEIEERLRILIFGGCVIA
ncbi:hypothetical protein BDV93DRAFT_495419 [Ceratobasidium sp. AG-I]|nr:hypothetical protein BDV93DRAFT_495419 [Ceratobasidium sp. AG-I]